MDNINRKPSVNGDAKGLTRSWSFSGLATMVRITLMYYVDFYSLLNHPEKDWEASLKAASEISVEPSIFE